MSIAPHGDTAIATIEHLSENTNNDRIVFESQTVGQNSTQGEHPSSIATISNTNNTNHQKQSSPLEFNNPLSGSSVS